MHIAWQLFFDDFAQAFARMDGALIARRYRVPYLAVQADGGSALYADASAVAQYFQQVLDAYHQAGCRRCRYRDLTVQAFSDDSGLATLEWDLLGDDDRVRRQWRESYVMVRGPEGWRITASMDHAQPSPGEGARGADRA